MACIDSIKDCEKRKGEEMFSVMISSAIAGMKSFMVNVEVDVSNGLPGFEIVGMAKRGAGDPTLRSHIYTIEDYPNYNDLNATPTLWGEDGKLYNTYPRILIRKKQ